MPIVKYDTGGKLDPDTLLTPALPVKVTSGKLGPNAAYDTKNWGADSLVWAYGYGSDVSIVNNTFGNGEQSGDIIIDNCRYRNTDYNASPTFNSETNVTRLFYKYLAPDNNWASFVGVWKLTGALASTSDIDVALGPSADHCHTLVVLRGLSEFY